MNEDVESGNTNAALKICNHLLREESAGLLEALKKAEKFLFIERHRKEFRVEKMCEVMGVSRSGFYKWRQGVKR